MQVTFLITGVQPTVGGWYADWRSKELKTAAGRGKPAGGFIHILKRFSEKLFHLRISSPSQSFVLHSLVSICSTVPFLWYPPMSFAPNSNPVLCQAQLHWKRKSIWILPFSNFGVGVSHSILIYREGLDLKGPILPCLQRGISWPTPREGLMKIWISVLHLNSGGIGKSTPSALEISLSPFHRGWILPCLQGRIGLFKSNHSL